MPTGPSNSTPAPDATPSRVTRQPRTLVLCFDGTSNEYGKNVTNVIKLYSLLRKDRAEEQLCYYQVSATFYSFQHSYVFVGGIRNVLRTGCR
jgi:uncharacterized protein (DUF2235 family)